MYAAFVTNEFGLGAVAKKKKAVSKTPAPSVPTTVETTDELVAGARLEWSAMFAIAENAGSSWSMESTNLANLSKQLQRKLEEIGLQGVQFKAVRSRWTNSDYAEQLVIEVTTPINRRRQADLQWQMEQAAKQVGLNVDPSPAHNNLRLVKQGEVAGVIGGAKARPGTGDNYTPQNNNTNGGDPNCGFLCGLGISTPFALAGGALLMIILMRR